MPYVSCMYAPPDETGMMGEELTEGENARITCIDDQGRTWWLSEDSTVGDYLAFIEAGGTIDPAPPPPLMPPPAIVVPERDYGAEIDALEARVTALENAAKT